MRLRAGTTTVLARGRADAALTRRVSCVPAPGPEVRGRPAISSSYGTRLQ